ncbi:MAG: TlpA family protein disulfide reductase [Planctomycetes bacterium]|nr:TlpA family protein disulfide reductase [Planctomycetota bacterium]
MKPIKLFCLILVLTFIAAGCKKKEPEPQQQDQAKVEAEEKPTGDKAPPGPGAKPAPSFTLQDLKGNQISLSDFKGKVVILDFWATWCPPCVVEIPHFIALYEQYKDQGFAMVGISVDLEGISVVKSFALKHRVNYPILMADGQVQKAYGGISNIPTTFVIDSAGNIRRKYVGYKDKAVFEADIKALLAEAKPPS